MQKIKYIGLHILVTPLIAFFPSSASLFFALSFCQKPFIAVISFFNCQGIIYEKITCQEGDDEFGISFDISMIQKES